MTDKSGQFDSHFEPGISPDLAEDLAGLYQPSRPVPAQVDRVVLEQAFHLLPRRTRPRRVWRWTAAASAAAALVLVVFLVEVLFHRPAADDLTAPAGSPERRLALKTKPAVPPSSGLSFDSDRSAPVDSDVTLETDQASFHLETPMIARAEDNFAAMSKPLNPADIDHNGRVDMLDAFQLARRIEAIVEPTAPLDVRWDMNGDGRVDREDIKTVALAAVRLEKGVL